MNQSNQIGYNLWSDLPRPLAKAQGLVLLRCNYRCDEPCNLPKSLEPWRLAQHACGDHGSGRSI